MLTFTNVCCSWKLFVRASHHRDATSWQKTISDRIDQKNEKFYAQIDDMNRHDIETSQQANLAKTNFNTIIKKVAEYCPQFQAFT